MGSMKVSSEAKEATIELTVIRADGRVENLGTVAYWHKNPLKRLAFRIKQHFKKGH